MKILPWAELVSQHLERVRRLELARVKLKKGEDPAEDDLETLEAWQKSTRTKGAK